MKWVWIAVVLFLASVAAFGGVEIWRRQIHQQAAALGVPTHVHASIYQPQLPKYPVAPGTAAVVDDLVHMMQTSTNPDEQMLADMRTVNLPGKYVGAVQVAKRRGGLSEKTLATLTRAEEALAARFEHEKHEAARRALFLRAALDAYDKHGHRDAQWDDAARNAITSMIDRPPAIDRTPEDDRRIAAAFHSGDSQLICDDPLVGYFAAKADASIDKSQAQADAGLRAAMKSMSRSAYTPACKLWTRVDGAALLSDEAGAQDRGDLLKDVSDLLPAATSDLSVPPAQRYQIARFYLDELNEDSRTPQGLVNPRFDRRKGFDAAFPLLQKVPEANVDALVLMGEFYTAWAWDARGDGLAKTVTPEGWRLFRKRLGAAREALEKAYELDPADARAPTRMLTVMMGLGNSGDKETWFKRAMKADPDNYDACLAKLTYLQPKWSGIAQLVLYFGNECEQTENFRGRIVLIQCEAITSLAELLDDPPAYLRQPKTWKALSTNYERYLSLYPRDLKVRHDYYALAQLTGNTQIAQEQFKLIQKQQTDR